MRQDEAILALVSDHWPKDGGDCLGIAPFTVDMQGDSSPSKFPIRPFQPCLCLIADERDLDRFSRGLR